MNDDITPTIEAASDAILPGSTANGAPGRVISLFDGVMQGFSSIVAALLDAFASDVRAGAAFTELTSEEKDRVLELMIEDPSVDVRDAADGLLLFTLGQNYVETNPSYQAIYDRIGYRGPSEGHPDYA